MENLSDTLAPIVALIVLAAIVGIFIRLAVKIRKGGGSLTTIVLGATDHFLTKEKSKAAEIIVDQKADKKFQEQHSEQSKDIGRKLKSNRMVN